MGHLHDGVILLLHKNPSGFCLIFLCELRLFYLNLTGITKFEYERRNEMNSGRSSKKTEDVIMQMSYCTRYFC